MVLLRPGRGLTVQAGLCVRLWPPEPPLRALVHPEVLGTNTLHSWRLFPLQPLTSVALSWLWSKADTPVSPQTDPKAQRDSLSHSGRRRKALWAAQAVGSGSNALTLAAILQGHQAPAGAERHLPGKASPYQRFSVGIYR